jgi:hypothetical protein
MTTGNPGKPMAAPDLPSRIWRDVYEALSDAVGQHGTMLFDRYGSTDPCAISITALVRHGRGRFSQGAGEVVPAAV